MIAALDVQQLQCIDASGVHLAMTRLYGRAPTGARVIGRVPQNSGQQITILGALRVHGVDAVMTVEGATDATVFRTYLTEVLGPTLRPGDIVVMENRGAHQATGSQQMLARRGVCRRYLPPSSPKRSPIELGWSTLKLGLRTAKARTRAALEPAIAQALTTITAADARGWFHHCGDTLH
jgi:transposase